MSMSFDRQHQPSRPARWSPMPDATGAPFSSPSEPGGSRPGTGATQDFREQADGAP